MQQLITADLDSAFRALRNSDPLRIKNSTIKPSPGYKSIPRNNFAPTSSAHTGGWGTPLIRTAAGNSGGISYGQPQFFSPVHTPINWQIPSKRLEIYQWQYLPNTQVLTEDFTYTTLENTEFLCNQIIEDTVVEGGYIFEADNYPKIMNSEGVFNQPPRLSMRNCEDKRCFSFTPLGNYRKVRISEEHHIFVLDGKTNRKNRKLIINAKYRRKKGIQPNGVTKIEIQDKLIKRVQAQDVKQDDYLLTPVPSCGNEKLSNDLSWIIGFCVADGHVCEIERTYVVNFTGHKGEKALGICEDILNDNFNGKISSVQHGDGNGWRVKASRKDTNKFFRNYIVNKGTNKKFSKELFNLDKESRLHILGGYFDGDGSLEKPGGKKGCGKLLANCYSEDLANQIYWLLLSCDIACSIGKYPLYGEHYDTDSDVCYRIYVPSSQVPKLIPYLRGDKIPSNFTPKKERDLRFFYTEDGVTYLAQPIDEIKEFLYTGKGYDIEMTNERKALVADGYVCSNSRFFYENEAKVASAIDFYSEFPMQQFEHECKNAKIKIHYDKLRDRLELPKWCRLISHEVHLLGDCFPLQEIDCPHCGGSGRIGDMVCDHEEGTVKRIAILNPDYVDIYHSSSISPEPIIALRPDEELINMVQRKTPGYESLSPEVIKLISAGQPIRLDNNNVSHLKYGECGYSKFGIGMVRRLFPVLSYKTKLMVAQWVVAERLIVPIKVVKVGTDERPAGPADIADVIAQLGMTANDPNLTIVTHHAFDVDFIGASGKVLTLSNEFELINQEILDGMMINNALLNGEGPGFSSAAVGIEAMIQRLETFRQEIAKWIEQKIYLPEAMRQGFIEENPITGEDEYIFPKIKWAPMHLRDQQQHRTFMLQLYDKGLISAQTVLESFDLDPDREIERKRYDALQMMAVGQNPQQGMAGGDGFGGGGMPALGGGGGGMDMGDLGGMGGGGGGGGGEPPISAPGGMGDMGGGDAGSPMEKSRSITAENVNPGDFGGKILKKKTRDRIQQDQQKVFRKQETHGVFHDQQGQTRDEKGRIMFTKAERDLIPKISQLQEQGLLKDPVYPQYRVQIGSQEYSLDFGIPTLKIGIEADGEIFHSSPEQVQRDNARDAKLQQQGWTILRFTDTEIETKGQQITNTILKETMRKRMWMEQNKPQDTNLNNPDGQ